MNDQPKTPTDAEREIFLEALDCGSAGERAGFLDRACAHDPALRLVVEALLQHHKADGFMQPSGLVSARLPAPEKPGDRIGRYKLLQQIGEGGCGVVYMAEQEEPVRRQVALKVIKLGMDTRTVIARFEAERQALALMDHPNIARVLDAGATDTGRPYFVMELVRGIKITDYCDQDNLATRDRLDLFIKVCHAIQHAHQKGIIHRDIKPSNILVTLRDGVPVPKVIDFGIAKATGDQRLTDKTLFTAFQQFIGTPAYMSPEQAEMSELGVDTRSDIYSLGVLLYELLTGQTPFGSAVLRQAGLDEIRRIIRHQEPLRPSTRLSTMTEGDLTRTARQRHAEPAKLGAMICGDLDWIVMKALEKDRSRRYETAGGLAADVLRHLGNEPVLARPPGHLYRFQKLAGRNKIAFISATAVAVALTVALVIAIVAVIRIKHDNQQIQQAKDDATEKLRGSYLAEARATRMSGQPGQRFASLDAVEKAAAIRPDLDVRNEAIACLAVSDLRVAREKVVTGHDRNELANFDLNMEQYVFEEIEDKITVRAASNDVIKAVLSAPGLTLDWAALFSPDGRYLGALYSRNGKGEDFWVWDLATQKTVIRAIQQEGGDGPADLQPWGGFSSDSRFFASFQSAGTISIYDLPSGRETKHFPCNRLLPHLAWDSGNTRLACFSSEGSRVEIREVGSGQTLLGWNCPTGVSAVAWSADGKRLATAGMDFSIYIWDAESGRRLSALEGHISYIQSLAFNHAGNLLASAGYEGIRLWNADAGRPLARLPGSSWQIRFSPDDRYLAGWQEGARYGSLEVASSLECRELYVPRDGRFQFGPAFSADGRILAAASNSRVRFWDAFSCQEIGFFRIKDKADIAFSPDGRSLIVVDHIDGVRQRSLEKVGGPASSSYRLGKPHSLFDAPDVLDASFSLDGRYLAVAQRTEGRALVFDLRNPPAKVVLAGHSLADRVAISSDGRWAATSSWHNPQVKIWDVRSRDLMRVLSTPDRAWATFSPDGRWLATSSADYQLWEVGSWQPKGPPKPGYDGPTENFTAFSPDGRIMARSRVNKIQLMETLTEKPLATLEAPGLVSVSGFQFSPDGTRLAALQADQQVRVWDLRLIRRELAPMHLDWDLPPYPPAGKTEAAGPVTLEVESDADNPPAARSESNAAVR